MWQLPPITLEEILIYLRKSRTDDPTLSVEEVLAKHEQMLNDWVARNMPDQGKIPEKNRLREVGSGETIDSRPAMKEVLKQIESPKIKAILVVEPQRLSRGSLEDIGRLVKLLRYSNTIVITLQYIYDLRDDRDRELFERELMRGNEFLEYQKRIMGNGRVLAVQNGNFVGNRAPYGFKRIQIKEGKKKCHTLEPIQEEAEVVRLIFDLYLQGYGVIRLSDKLLELGIKAPNGKRWSHTTLREMLRNEHYVGKVRWFHKKTIKTVENGEVVAHRPRAEKYLVYPGKHPAIVDQDVFDAVQKKIGEIPRATEKRPLQNPFAGLVYCACGHAVSRHSYITRGVETAAPRFLCKDQRHCGNASCLATEFVDAVRKKLVEELEDMEARLERGEDNSYDIHLQAVNRLEKRLAELEKQEESQWEKYTLEGMPKHIFDNLNKKVLEEKEEVQEALCVAKGSIPEPVHLEEKVQTFHKILDMLDDPDAPVVELNALLKEVISRITYSRPNSFTVNKRWGTGNDIHIHIEGRV